MIVHVTFWAAVALVLYAYFGYPCLLIAISLVSRRGVRRMAATCPVSFIITAHNEDARIAAKIENTLAQDYPGHARDRRRVGLFDRRHRRRRAALCASGPAGARAGASRQGSRPAACHRRRLGRHSGLFRRRDRAGARRRVAHRRELCGPDRRLRQQRRSLRRRRRARQRRRRVRPLRDVPARARDAGEQPRWPERIVLRRAPGRLPQLGGGPSERFQHAAQCGRSWACAVCSIRPSIGYYHPITDHRRRVPDER